MTDTHVAVPGQQPVLVDDLNERIEIRQVDNLNPDVEHVIVVHKYNLPALIACLTTIRRA